MSLVGADVCDQHLPGEHRELLGPALARRLTASGGYNAPQARQPISGGLAARHQLPASTRAPAHSSSCTTPAAAPSRPRPRSSGCSYSSLRSSRWTSVPAWSSSGEDPASAVSASTSGARRDSGRTLLPFPIRPDPLEACRRGAFLRYSGAHVKSHFNLND